MAPVSELQKLIMIIIDLDFKKILELAVDNRSKKNSFTFFGALKNHKDDEIALLLSALNEMVIKCLENNLGSSGTIEWASADLEDIGEVCQIIQATIDIAMTTFQLKIPPSESLLQMVLLLNSILPEIPANEDSIKNNICQLCEKMYSANFIEKCEYFLFNVAIYLLRRSLVPKAFKVDVKRVYSLRKVIFNIISMNHPSAVDIWVLLKNCAKSFVYIGMTEGQKIISMSLAIDAECLLQVHEILQSQLPACSIKVAMNYGKIYYDAWYQVVKNQNKELKDIIEISCLQKYILLAIHPSNAIYLPHVRKLLGYFYCQKKEFEVAKMLYVLYQPLLWRYLKNADGQLRANASQLFLDIFPLEDPEVNLVDSELELNEQLLMIKSLLTDEFPVVRLTTVVGICIAMSVNWEIFPEDVLKSYFRIIINDLSSDSSSEDVRLGVIRGMKVLLENPFATPTLRSILPKIKGMFHDNSERVRIAFTQLLLKVKNVSDIKYFDVVPLNDILARMPEDTHAVQKTISNLIHNSYFPKPTEPKIWLGRTIEILKMSPAAARVLFTHVSCFISLEESVKFAVQAVKAIHFYVKTEKKSGDKRAPFMRSRLNRNGDNIVVSHKKLKNALGFDSSEIVSALMDCITVFWLTLKGILSEPEHKSQLKAFVGKIGALLSELCVHYKNTSVWKSVFYLTSFMPSYLVPSLGSLCFWRLKSLPPDAEPPDYMIVVECLCNQQQTLELLQLLHEWIAVGFNDSFTPPVKKRKKNGTLPENMYYNDPKPHIAAEVLNGMLCHKGMQKAALMYQDTLRNMLGFFDFIKASVENNNSATMKDAEADFLKLLMFDLLRISLFLHDEEKDTSVAFLDEVTKWAEKRLVKVLKSSKFASSNIYTELIYSICKNLCEVLSDATGLGFCNPRSGTYLQYFVKILNTKWGFRFAVISSRFAYKHISSAQFEYLVNNEIAMLQHSVDFFCKLIDSFTNSALLDKISVTDLKSIQFVFSNVVQVMQNHISTLAKPVSDAFKSIIKNVLKGVMIKTSQIVIKMGSERFDKITFPKQGAFFLSILTQKPKSFMFSMKYFDECYKEYYSVENLTNQDKLRFWIACCALLFRVLHMNNLQIPIMKEIRLVCIGLENTLKCIYPQKRDSASIDPDNKENYLKTQEFEGHLYSELSKLRSLFYLKSKEFKKQ